MQFSGSVSAALQPQHCGQDTHDVATWPLAVGGLGLRSGRACWARWEDPMISERHPQVAEMFVVSLEGHPHCLFEGNSSWGVMGFEPPSCLFWQGAWPDVREPRRL